jgi:sigma-70-like protein
MSRLDELPPDQRAALSLLLRQRKGYAELAAVLGIPPRAVHDRAHAALAVLAPRQARELTPERREEIGEYLLGQQGGVAERLATRTYLGGSAPAQAWARALASELAPLASAGLPEIPDGAVAGASPTKAPGARTARLRAPSGKGIAAPSSGSLPSSRLGGALILAAILAAIIVAVVLLSSGGSSHAKTTASSPPATTATGSASGSASTSTPATSTTPSVGQRLTLRPTDPSSKSTAAVDVIAEGSKRAFYIEAQNLPPSRGFFYAIWLYNSASSFLPLSKSPPVGSNKRLAGGALLPSNASSYHEMLLTRETSERPKSPGQIVMRGPFSLGG